MPSSFQNNLSVSQFARIGKWIAWNIHCVYPKLAKCVPNIRHVSPKLAKYAQISRASICTSGAAPLCSAFNVSSNRRCSSCHPHVLRTSVNKLLLLEGIVYRNIFMRFKAKKRWLIPLNQILPSFALLLLKIHLHFAFSHHALLCEEFILLWISTAGRRSSGRVVNVIFWGSLPSYELVMTCK